MSSAINFVLLSFLEMKKIFLSSCFVVYLFLLFPYSITMASEEAQYDVVHKTDIYEIRHYLDRLVVQAPFSSNRSDGSSFRKLFKYISGANNTSEEIKMTVPVTQTKNSLIARIFKSLFG